MRKAHPILPEMLFNRIQMLGFAGQQWLDKINVTVSDIEQRWHLTVGNAFQDSTEGRVLPSKRSRNARSGSTACSNPSRTSGKCWRRPISAIGQCAP